jgi:alpha-L-fucosidase
MPSLFSRLGSSIIFRRATVLLLALTWSGLVFGAPAATAEVRPAEPTGFSPELEAARQKRIQWWREARFGMFIHWGLYAVPGGVWGTNVQRSGYSEWIMWGRKIPAKEYALLAGQFNPVKFDAAGWVKIAKDAGMKYMVLTTKHHEGFSMFKSSLTPYNIVDATPFKRDVTQELAKACRAEGLRFGCYYSVDRDWYRPLGPGNRYKQNNLWDYPDSPQSDFDTYFEGFAKPQVEELLKQYRPDVLWFDGIDMMSDAQAGELYQSIRKLQPNCVVNSRIKSVRYSDKNAPRLYDYLSTGDNEIAGKTLAIEWENPGTLNTSYGYNQNDNNWVPAEKVVHRLVEIVSKGGNYLLNVGPTAEGIIPQASLERLQEVGAWMKINQEAIYGTSPWKVAHEGPTGKSEVGQETEKAAPLDIRFTAKGNSVYAICMTWPEKDVLIRALGKEAFPGKKITAVRMLGSKDKIKWQQTAEGLSLSVPKTEPCRHAFVYRVDTK